MSTVERNKGRLVPTSEEEVLLLYPGADLDDVEWETEQNVVKIKDKYYLCGWEVQAQEDCSYFSDVVVNDDGSINFHTLHYNGGAHWTEVIEESL